MAELPVFRRSSGLPGGPGLPRVSPGQTGAGIAAVALGEAAAAGDEIVGVLDDIQKTKESAWITRATGEAEIYADEVERRLEGESTEGAPGHVNAFRGEFGSYRDQVLASAPSGRARAALETRLTNVEVAATRRRGAFQAKAELTKRGGDLETGLNGLVFAVQQNPGRLGEILQRLDGDLEAASAWLPGDALTDTRSAAHASVVTAAVEGFVKQEDFVMARLLVEGDEFGSRLDANTRSTLLDRVEGAETGAFVRDEGRAIGEAMSSSSRITSETGEASPELVAAVTHTESRGNPNAVSPKGATGVMQLMPGTAREIAAEIGVEYDESKLKDPEYNTLLGTAYLNKQLAKYGGNPVLALAAYNAGPGNVDKWIERFGDPRTGEISSAEFASKIPFDETRNYVAKIEERMGGTVLSPDEVLSAGVSGITDPAIRDRVAREAGSVFALTAGERARTKAAEDAVKAQILAGLQVAVSRNQAGYSDIDQAFAQGQISPAEWSSLTRAKDSAIEAERKKTEDLSKARARLANGIKFNVFENEDRKLVDKLYEVSDGTPEAAMAISAKTNIVPSAVVSDLQVRMRQADVAAFEMADNLDRAAPQGLQSGDGRKDVAARVDEFRGLVRAGYTPEEAARRSARTDRERAEAAPLVSEAKKDFGKLTFSDMLGELEADGIFVNMDPSRNGRLSTDFETAYVEARIDGNPHDDALKVAASRLNRVWGNTAVNGNTDEVMRFPPEQYYPSGPPGMGHKYIRDQAISLIEKSDGATPASIQMLSDLQTEADIRAGIPPRYKLFYTDESGVLQEALGYYRPDPRAASFLVSSANKRGFEEKRTGIEQGKAFDAQQEAELGFAAKDATP